MNTTTATTMTIIRSSSTFLPLNAACDPGNDACDKIVGLVKHVCRHRRGSTPTTTATTATATNANAHTTAFMAVAFVIVGMIVFGPFVCRCCIKCKQLPTGTGADDGGKSHWPLKMFAKHYGGMSQVLVKVPVHSGAGSRRARIISQHTTNQRIEGILL